MNIPIEGPRRGLIARWLMRLEASQGVIRMVFLGVTAASTMATALALLDLGWALPYLMTLGFVGVFVYAFAYVELGIYLRKNREKRDRGENFAKPQNMIGNVILARGIRAAELERPLTEDERQAVDEEIRLAYRELRNGVVLED